nr:hypothetical protein CFP56_07673 [Quercus suber]
MATPRPTSGPVVTLSGHWHRPLQRPRDGGEGREQHLACRIIARVRLAWRDARRPDKESLPPPGPEPANPMRSHVRAAVLAAVALPGTYRTSIQRLLSIAEELTRSVRRPWSCSRQRMRAGFGCSTGSALLLRAGRRKGSRASPLVLVDHVWSAGQARHSAKRLGTVNHASPSDPGPCTTPSARAAAMMAGSLFISPSQSLAISCTDEVDGADVQQLEGGAVGGDEPPKLVDAASRQPEVPKHVGQSLKQRLDGRFGARGCEYAASLGTTCDMLVQKGAPIVVERANKHRPSSPGLACVMLHPTSRDPLPPLSGLC